MNLSVSVWGAAEWLCYAIIVGFLWKSLAAHLADSPIGKAMAYII